MERGLRVVYAGTPDFAVPALRSLQESKHSVVAVYTQPDRPAGRGRKLQSSPVKRLAQAVGIPVEQPLSFVETGVKKQLQSYQADVMVVAAYGLLLPLDVLGMFPHGCLNIHASLLPRWRGAAPIHRVIQAGDQESGVTIMQMAEGLDTGDMLLKLSLPVTPQIGGQNLHDQLANIGAEALMSVLDQVLSGSLQVEPQDELQACYAHKITKAEAEIDWQQASVVIDRQIRAFDGWPVAFNYLNDEKKTSLRFFVSRLSEGESVPAGVPGEVVAESQQGIDIIAGDGRVVRILELQYPGGRRMSAADFLNARSLLGVKLRHSKVLEQAC